MTEKKSIWRMPVMWLVVGLPLASIIAGVGLVITAVNTGGADSVTDKVDRMSQIQTTDLGPDNQAQVLKLSAIMRVDGGMVEVLPVTGEFKRNAPLRLSRDSGRMAAPRLRRPPPLLYCSPSRYTSYSGESGIHADRAAGARRGSFLRGTVTDAPGAAST